MKLLHCLTHWCSTQQTCESEMQETTFKRRPTITRGCMIEPHIGSEAAHTVDCTKKVQQLRVTTPSTNFAKNGVVSEKSTVRVQANTRLKVRITQNKFSSQAQTRSRGLPRGVHWYQRQSKAMVYRGRKRDVARGRCRMQHLQGQCVPHLGSTAAWHCCNFTASV